MNFAQSVCVDHARTKGKFTHFSMKKTERSRDEEENKEE